MERGEGGRSVSDLAIEELGLLLVLEIQDVFIDHVLGHDGRINVLGAFDFTQTLRTSL